MDEVEEVIEAFRFYHARNWARRLTVRLLVRPENPARPPSGGGASPRNLIHRCVVNKFMKMIAAIVFVTLALVPAGPAAQATDLTGNWNATFTRTAPTGQTQSITFTFHFTQKGKELTGTIGPEPARQWKVEKGLVDGAKVTFQVQQPDGPLRSFELTHANGKLTGNMHLDFNGQTADVVVDAERAK